MTSLVKGLVFLFVSDRKTSPFGVGNITDEAVQKYIKEQVEESRREDSGSTALYRIRKSACDTALRGEQ